MDGFFRDEWHITKMMDRFFMDEWHIETMMDRFFTDEWHLFCKMIDRFFTDEWHIVKMMDRFFTDEWHPEWTVLPRNSEHPSWDVFVTFPKTVLLFYLLRLFRILWQFFKHLQKYHIHDRLKVGWFIIVANLVVFYMIWFCDI